MFLRLGSRARDGCPHLPEVGPTLTMTVAMMDSSASLKPSMRWELWVPSLVSSSFLHGEESPWASSMCSGVWGPDMTGPLPSGHRSLGGSTVLSMPVGTGIEAGCGQWGRPPRWPPQIACLQAKHQPKTPSLNLIVSCDAQRFNFDKVQFMYFYFVAAFWCHVLRILDQT